ncbi:MAG: CHASE domain-containing protein, partial [Phycisphaerales bacterium]
MLVSLISLLASTVAYIHVTNIRNQSRIDRVYHDELTIRDELENRLSQYTLGLGFGQSFYNSSKFVSREEWTRFYDTQKLDQYFPGVMGYAFVKAVDADRVDRFVQAMRDSGVPDYAVQVPAGFDDAPIDRQRYLIKYHVPEERNRQAWGLDVGVNPVNRAVYDRARDTGDFSVSKPFKLFQDGEKKWGVVIAAPVYLKNMPTATIEQRRSAIKGWVAVSIGIEQFMDTEWESRWDQFDIKIMSCVPESHQSTVYYNSQHDRLTDSSENQCVDVSEDQPAVAHADSEDLILQMGDQSLKLCFTTKDAYAKWFGGPRQLIVLVAGLLISSLLTIITWSVTQTRTKAIIMARSMTKSLRDSEHRQRILTV